MKLSGDTLKYNYFTIDCNQNKIESRHCT